MPAMDIQVSKESDVPIHEQLAAQIVMLIGSGKLRPGDALPSARELAQRLRIHRNTVSQAFRDLVLNLLVEKSHGRRLIVRPFQAARVASGGKLDALINAFVLEILRRGYTLGELYRQVQARVLAAPPDHILVVSNDSGMRLLLPAELKEKFKLRVDSCSVSELVSKPELTIAALVLSPPGHIAAIAGLLPPERPPLAFTHCIGLCQRIFPEERAGDPVSCGGPAPLHMRVFAGSRRGQYAGSCGSDLVRCRRASNASGATQEGRADSPSSNRIRLSR